MDKLSQSSSASARDHYNRQRQDNSSAHTENVYYVHSDISNLQGKLEQGSMLNARIVLCLGDKKYLLRFLGGNYIMHSELDFKRFEEVKVCVEKTETQLELRILPNKTPPKHNGKLDISI
jgi:hypothetical protein